MAVGPQIWQLSRVLSLTLTLNAGQGGSVTGRGLRLAKSGVVLCIDNWRDKSSYRAPVPECEVTSHSLTLGAR